VKTLVRDFTLSSAPSCQRWGFCCNLVWRGWGSTASGVVELSAHQNPPWEGGCYRAELLKTLNYGIQLNNV